jgi:Reverse transcriptase (RNA-dependent DNA polymerase)
LRNLDIVTAFLNGDMDTEIHMGVPEGMDLDPKKFVLKLRRSLYGLKQAPRIWWERMSHFLLQSGFTAVKQNRLFSFETKIAHFLFFFFSLMTFCDWH